MSDSVTANPSNPRPGATGVAGVQVPSPGTHARRIVCLMALATVVLAWLIAHTDILFADGLRYITQAQMFARGETTAGLKSAVDHPVYPFVVSCAHAMLGGETPEAWQLAAQLAAAAAAVLLVIPAYLTALELFGTRTAVVGGVLLFVVPLTGHVCADTLSESTFLLFWAWGVWGALRFLRSGKLGWLVLVLAASALAYLTRPEGVLLPAALVSTLVLCPRWLLGNIGGRRAAIGLGVLLVGLAAVVGPYVLLKGGLGTKPSIARLLGTAPRSDRFAVERARPLDPDQTLAKTYTLAARAVVKAVTEAMTPALLLLAGVGLASLRPRGAEARQWTLLAVIGLAAVLALVRLHATGGYCSPRHVIVLTLVAIPAAAHGLTAIAAQAAAWLETGRAWASLSGKGDAIQSALLGAAVCGLVVWLAPMTLAPVNPGMHGYRDAGHWLREHRAGDDGSRIVDLTGWSQFYGQRPAGYTFQNVHEAMHDPDARWVVAREAHLVGPWYYCQHLKSLIGDRRPVQVFLGRAEGRTTRVLVFDRRTPQTAGHPTSLRR